MFTKDGKFQMVREYKVENDKVRYVEAETGASKEVPLESVDLKRTEAGGGRNNDLTPEKEALWKKWIDIYRAKMLSRGEYLGGLYDIGFYRPEAHAIRKPNGMYYAFYAPEFKGQVELRGLGKGTYTVRDYENGKDLGTVKGPSATIDVQFAKHLLIEAKPQ
jgi:alpha-galactosidase